MARPVITLASRAVSVSTLCRLGQLDDSGCGGPAHVKAVPQVSPRSSDAAAARRAMTAPSVRFGGSIGATGGVPGKPDSTCESAALVSPARFETAATMPCCSAWNNAESTQRSAPTPRTRLARWPGPRCRTELSKRSSTSPIVITSAAAAMRSTFESREAKPLVEQGIVRRRANARTSAAAGGRLVPELAEAQRDRRYAHFPLAATRTLNPARLNVRTALRATTRRPQGCSHRWFDWTRDWR
jgi:hypothetical protein